MIYFSLHFYKEFIYSRAHNPSRKVLEQALAAIEGAKYGK